MRDYDFTGLMVSHEVEERSVGLVLRFAEYRVPLHDHAAYCLQC